MKQYGRIMHNLKRSIAVLLCLVVLCTIVPLAVFAAETNAGKILNDAYALEEGRELSYDATLTGKITRIDTPYNATYCNISVTIMVSGYADKPVLCFRLKGIDTDKLAIGDTITVTGKIKNYLGTIEYGQGCTLDKVVKGNNEAVVAPSDPKQIVDAAFALEKNSSLPYMVTLTGKITKIVTPYDSDYKNITVNIEVAGSNGNKTIECYRLKGDGVDKICAGDTITVKGRLKNYNGKVEFDAGCEMTSRKSAGVEKPSDPKQIVDAAFALEKNASLPYTATLKGTITEIVDAYSEQYKNITVIIEVEGTSGKKTIECYRMKGDGADYLKVDDYIAVTGILTRYYKAATEDKNEIDRVEFNSGCTFVKTSAPSPAVNTLFVKVPADWTAVNAYAWSDSDKAILGDWPGTTLSTKDGDWYKIVLPEPAVGLVINNGAVQSSDLEIQPGKDVYVTVASEKNADGKHRITAQYADGTTGGNKSEAADDVIIGTESNFRVVGNADWMGNWDPASDAGRMLEVSPGVYKRNFDNVQPGSYELRITQYGTWDMSWGDNGYNVRFEVVETCTITITFLHKGENGSVTVKGSGVESITGTWDCEHNYETKVVAPTCTQDGSTIHTCTRCGDCYTGGTTPAIGHRFMEYVADGNAGCTADGTRTSTCRICGMTKSEWDEGSALGHSFTNYLDDCNALCWREGTKTAKCDRCKETDTISVPGSTLPHQYIDGFCMICGAEEENRILGDLSGDGKVNIGDVAKLYSHIRGKTILEEENLILYADITGDGKINIGDAALLYAQVRQ